ncbi:lipase family protein [Jinshanibacter sp. LJY008]|uniref:Lipase family protein n=1 Tax=Limnobaculum eriocheiris TaxID=2897391 RepID=A0A9X1SM35_9GAMM|nr:lipase family protein [Limnobaculum eriocheiris]MCD1127746.1 lipase family protein [Limnobaculum eriocheiris]
MSETRTSNSGEYGKAAAPNQKRYRGEIKLVDDHDNPVSGMTYWVDNQETRDKRVAQYTGISDADGVIRLENLAYSDVTLTIDAQPLADEMEKRTLKSKWVTPYQMKMTPAIPDTKTKNIVYQVVIGQLCNSIPKQEIDRQEVANPSQMNKDEKKADQNEGAVEQDKKKVELAEISFHFPDPQFSGLTIAAMYLMEQQVVVKICPFRAWNLVLHHQKEYSMVNAYNLGFMANITYEKEEFFNRFMKNFWDLSTIPSLKNDRQLFYAVVKDVPFSEGYTVNQFLNTDMPKGGEGDSQLFYIANNNMILVSWRGSQEGPDWVSNFTFRPIPHQLELEDKKGFVHKGFWEAFDIARKKFGEDFDKIKEIASDKKRKLFISGHSLGGALSVIHSAVLKSYEPLVYTYGMPRVFTYGVVRQLQNVMHYRHVNDGDLVTFVPPQAELDSKMYDIWGSLGTYYGTWASMLQWISLSTDIDEQKKNELYVHHGDVVLFFKAQQSVVYNIHVPENNEDAMQDFTIRGTLPLEAKFYLVSTLSEEQYVQSEVCQRNFVDCADKQSLREFFPAYETPTRDSIKNPLHHFMPDRYIPFLNNQLIELVDTKRSMIRKDKRQEFIDQMKKHEIHLSKDEKKRNQLFISMQSALQNTLTVTQELQGGEDALSRFKQTAKEDVEK